jgi:hypothetical protein
MGTCRATAKSRDHLRQPRIILRHTEISQLAKARYGVMAIFRRQLVRQTQDPGSSIPHDHVRIRLFLEAGRYT